MSMKIKQKNKLIQKNMIPNAAIEKGICNKLSQFQKYESKDH